jgi:hypothetical protein
MRRAFLLLLLLLTVVGALMYWLLGFHVADPGYLPVVERRTWPSGGPAVAIDDAHWNLQTASRGYGPFAKLLVADGYTVIEKGNAASREVLDAARIVVIANALGLRGLVRQTGQLAGFRLEALAADAFTSIETGRLEAWVRDGGSLLLAADPTPASRAMQSLAQQFGVTMGDGFVYDPEHSESEDRTVLVFSRESRLLGSHAIIHGSHAADAVRRVVTFTGQALDGPAHATRLLVFSRTAFEAPRLEVRPTQGKPVGGMAQALAFEHGRGRVVVVGDASVLTSQVTTAVGGAERERMGLQWPNSDNERFARHIMGWLSGAGG